MHRFHFLLVALCAGVLTGCVLKPKRSYVSWLPRLGVLRGVDAKDVIQMDVALLEAPVGSSTLNKALWIPLDEQFLPFEQKHLLEQNGLRIAKVGASPPQELLELLTSERHSPNPRRMQFRAGKAAPPISLGPKRDELRFELHKMAKENESFELKHAEVELEIVPTATDDGRTKLKITPHVRHGKDNRQLWKPNADRSGWMMQLSRPEVYESLSWEVTLAPGEYLVIGGRFDRKDTLGGQTFVRTDEPTPVQRLLVLRTTRKVPGLEKSARNNVRTSKPAVAPLALQASWAARGSSQ